MPPMLPDVLREALARLRARLAALAPRLEPAFTAWAHGLAGEDRGPESYFLHPSAFPLLLLPWWLDEALGGEVDLDLQRELVYSSISGYYAIRLIDDVMDRGDAAALALLPATGILDAEFVATYSALFSADHPFWRDFFVAWGSSREASWEDARLAEIDLPTFARVSARKVAAGIIPLAAVAARAGRAELPAAWVRLFDRLCEWHQLHNDLIDWKRDLDAGASTWFLSEGRRRREAREPVDAWVVREGFEVGIADLEHRLATLIALCRDAESPALERYLEERRAMLATLAADGRAGLAAARVLLSLETRETRETCETRETRERNGGPP